MDQDNDQYIKMLMAPKLSREDYFEHLYDGLRTFLFRIFDQEKDDSYRRLRAYVQREHECKLDDFRQYYYGPGTDRLRRLMKYYDQKTDYYQCGDQRFKK